MPLTKVANACDVSGFSCGEPSLDDWLKETALRAEGRSARTYVVRSGDRVVAYYCLATGSVERARLPRKIRHGNPNTTPVFVLGRLAVDSGFQGRGLGHDLMSHCFRQSHRAAELVGCRGLVLHPLNDGLVRFYRDLGFQDLHGEPRAMFIALETIAAGLAADS